MPIVKILRAGRYAGATQADKQFECHQGDILLLVPALSGRMISNGNAEEADPDDYGRAVEPTPAGDVNFTQLIEKKAEQREAMAPPDEDKEQGEKPLSKKQRRAAREAAKRTQSEEGGDKESEEGD